MASRRTVLHLAFVAAALVGCQRHDGRDALVLPASDTLAATTRAATSPGVVPASYQPESRSNACPEGMAHVVGEFCPDVVQTCKRWMDPPGERFSDYRCAEYAPSKCASKQRRHMDFCMDVNEWAPAGSDLPASEMSWTDGKRVCESEGKRLCMESEYNFACEGEEMRPYPYGFSRDATACNADLVDIYEAGGARIKDLRARHGTHPKCASPFGVMDMAGNLEEFVTIDGAGPPRPAMKGAWWQPSRNFCRANQIAHDRWYKGRETGFRCCSDVPDGVPGG